MSFKVRLRRDAQAGLARDGGDLTLPEQAIVPLRAGIATLMTSPFTCRKTGQSQFLRELIFPFGRSGYVALFEIEDASNVVVVAVRHQSRTTTIERRQVRLVACAHRDHR